MLLSVTLTQPSGRGRIRSMCDCAMERGLRDA